MVKQRRQYIRAIRRLEDLLLECLGNPIEANWDRLRAAKEEFPELESLGVQFRAVIEKPVPEDACIVLVETFADIRNAVPVEVVVYVLPSVDEGEVGIRDLYLSRLSES